MFTHSSNNDGTFVENVLFVLILTLELELLTVQHRILRHCPTCPCTVRDGDVGKRNVSVRVAKLDPQLVGCAYLLNGHVSNRDIGGDFDRGSGFGLQPLLHLSAVT